jgi:hypothetical protein
MGLWIECSGKYKKKLKGTLESVCITTLLFIIIGCRPSSESAGDPEKLQSPSSDSTLQADPWIKYSYSERRGKLLYEHYCSHCHGILGRGDGFNAFTLNPRPRILADSSYSSALDDTTLNRTIAHGGRGVNRSVLMPAFSHTLKSDEISSVVDYIQTFFSKRDEE